MARMTQAQRIEQDNELQALAFFEGALDTLPDPRRPQGVRYPLRTVVVSALMAMVCGCDDAESMQVWAEANASWLASTQRRDGWRQRQPADTASGYRDDFCRGY